MMMISRNFAALMCLLFVFGTESTTSMAAMIDLGGPIRSQVAFVTDSARSEFLERMTDFAKAQGFSVSLNNTRPDGTHVIVEMWRKDVKIVALNPFDDGEEFRIDLYQTANEKPSQTVAETVDALVDGLRGAIGKLQGVRLADDKTK
jgi:hypothetical protein